MAGEKGRWHLFGARCVLKADQTSERIHECCFLHDCGCCTHMHSDVWMKSILANGNRLMHIITPTSKKMTLRHAFLHISTPKERINGSFWQCSFLKHTFRTTFLGLFFVTSEKTHTWFWMEILVIDFYLWIQERDLFFCSPSASEKKASEGATVWPSWRHGQTTHVMKGSWSHRRHAASPWVLWTRSASSTEKQRSVGCRIFMLQQPVKPPKTHGNSVQPSVRGLQPQTSPKINCRRGLHGAFRCTSYTLRHSSCFFPPAVDLPFVVQESHLMPCALSF